MATKVPLDVFFNNNDKQVFIFGTTPTMYIVYDDLTAGDKKLWDNMLDANFPGGGGSPAVGAGDATLITDLAADLGSIIVPETGLSFDVSFAWAIKELKGKPEAPSGPSNAQHVYYASSNNPEGLGDDAWHRLIDDAAVV